MTITGKDDGKGRRKVSFGLKQDSLLPGSISIHLEGPRYHETGYSRPSSRTGPVRKVFGTILFREMGSEKWK